MREIQIEYNAEVKNYFEAAKYFAKSRRKRNIFDKIMVVFIILAGIIQFPTGNFILGIILTAGGILLSLGVVEKIVTYIYFKLYVSKIGKQKLFISENKIKYEIKNINSEIEWSYYQDFIETPNTIMLLYRKKYYSVLPKNAFSKEDLKKFIILIHEKFPVK